MSLNKPIIIGSRGSELALWQAEFVKKQLLDLGHKVEIQIIKTQGDKIQNLSFDKLEGKGFFTKELEEALLNKEIDLAVHSHKDLPTVSPDGLVIAAVSYREDPSELVLIRKDKADPKLKFHIPLNAVVGTSSARRKSQLINLRPDVTLKDLRGNVPTRLRKLIEGEYDAIMLAAAGIERLQLDLTDVHAEKLDPREFIPAPGQGVLALQTRDNDNELIAALQEMNHQDVRDCIAVERKILNLFDGGCQLPLGAYCIKPDEDKDIFHVWASKADGWDKTPRMVFLESKRDDLAELIVQKLSTEKSGKVYITRDIRKNDIFKRTLEGNGYKVEGNSLIEIKPVPFKPFEAVTWIFFPSKHAVRYFFTQKPTLRGNEKFAAVGKSTAEELRKYNVKPDFIGYSTDTRLTAKQFASGVGNNKVLFPQAKGSLRSIQKAFNPSQVIDLVVYETLKHNHTVPAADIIVFTSPSNVEAFFEKNKLSDGCRVVAMGGATAGSLKEKGVLKSKQPGSFDDIGLAQAVMSI